MERNFSYKYRRPLQTDSDHKVEEEQVHLFYNTEWYW